STTVKITATPVTLRLDERRSAVSPLFRYGRASATRGNSCQTRCAGGLTLERLLLCTLSAATISLDRKSTRLNSSHVKISYAVFCVPRPTLFPYTTLFRSLLQLSRSRQRQLLSAWMKGEAQYRPSLDMVERLQREVIHAKPDAQAALHWKDYYYVRYQQQLYR